MSTESCRIAPSCHSRSRDSPVAERVLLASRGVNQPDRLSRSYATWLLYAVFASMAFLLNGMGAVLAPLQRELGVSRGEVAFYPSLFAVGLIVVGISGGTFVNRI